MGQESTIEEDREAIKATIDTLSQEELEQLKRWLEEIKENL